MRHIPLPLSNGLMTILGLEPRFLRLDLCSEVRLGLVTCWGRLGRWFLVFSRNSVRLAVLRSGGIQVEGLQYVGRLVVSGWFLKWNCFFMVWMRRVADFCTRWCVEAGGIGTKLRPRASTSVSIGDRWWGERFLMALFLKLVCSFWRTRHLVLLKFFVVRISGKSFLNEGLACGRLGDSTNDEFLESSVRVMFMYA